MASVESASVRGTWPIAILLLVSVAAALWAAGPFWDLGAIAPTGGSGAATVGAGVAIALIAAIVLVGLLLVWLARKRARQAVRWFMLAAVAFGLLLCLTPFIVDHPSTGAWLGGVAVAAALAWILRGPGAPAWTGATLAAGGYAGLLAAVAGLAVLVVAVAAVCLYDAWAVQRHRMGRVADAADALEAPLQVGRPGRLSLGLGDLLLPAALVAAAADPSRAGAMPMAPALLGCAGLLAGLALLAAAVRSGGDMPGTPFLCGGALAGIAGGLALHVL